MSSRIGFLEPLPDLAEARGAVLVVDAVIGDAVDEEEREHLDALALEGALLLEMLLDGLVDLRLHDVVGQPADFLPQLQEAALIELDVFGAGGAVDVLDDVAVAIGLALVGLLEQVVALLDPKLRRLWARRPALWISSCARMPFVLSVLSSFT